MGLVVEFEWKLVHSVRRMSVLIREWLARAFVRLCVNNVLLEM